MGVLVGKAVGRMYFLHVALNPLEVKKLAEMKRTTIVLEGEISGGGIFCPQDLPGMDHNHNAECLR